jgi:hypothetical protein
VKKIIIILLLCFPCKAQFLQDYESIASATIGLDKLYNLDFGGAEQSFKPILLKYKNHPVDFLIQASILQWKNLPIEQNPIAFKHYLTLLEKCKDAAYNLYKNDSYKSEAIFYLLSSHGNISRGYHFHKEYVKAGWEARKAYGYLKQGFELSSINPDFLFTNGLYKFYREQYPISHPEIKPIVYFFAEGNKIQGLNDLRNASKLALFTKTESAYFLAGICLKYENKYAEALTITEKLHEKYPRNPDFLLKYTEALIANNQLDLANKMNASLCKNTGLDYQLASAVFAAEITKNEEIALAKLNAALSLKGEGRYTSDLRSMALLNLGKIYLDKKDNQKAALYLKECLAITEYTRIIKEAKKLLDSL